MRLTYKIMHCIREHCLMKDINKEKKVEFYMHKKVQDVSTLRYNIIFPNLLILLKILEMHIGKH